MSFELEFQVKSINWRNNNIAYITASQFACKNTKIKRQLGRTMKLKGYFNTIFEGDRFLGEADLLEDKKTGVPYLYIKKIPKLIIPEKEETLAKFLTRRVKGLGLKKAKVIVEKLGLDCIDVITANPLVLLSIPELKYKKEQVEKIANQLNYCKSYEEVAIFIQSIGLPLSIANKLYDKYKDDTIVLLRENPYQICYDGEITFTVADKIAKECKLNYNDPLRVRTGMLSYLNYQLTSCGDSCVYKDEKIYKSKKNFYDLFNKYLKTYGSIKGKLTVEEIDESIETLIIDKKISLELDGTNKYLYIPLIQSIENNISNKIKSMMNRTFKFCNKTEIDDFLGNYKGMNLDPKQIEAVYNALTHNISILTGGPGTGKTATINIIVQAIKEICIKTKKRKADIVLLGPTGKAADRITELTNNSASTIHRKLMLREDIRFTDVSLDVDYVIVDESSMIDIYLMEQLLTAMEGNTRLIFVGDINQLPSVGPGKVLDDMIASGVIPTVTLTTIFRQANGSEIVENAHRINNEIDTKNGFTLNKGNFHFIEENNSIEIKNDIYNLISDLLNKGYNKKDIAILSPMRDKDAGTIELNELFQENFKEPNAPECEIMGQIFRKGDRVIQTKNNYDLGVFNGFVGTIVEIYEDNNQTFIVVDFDNQSSVVEYDESSALELELSYAMTVHKSQGSEYPVVIMPMHLCQSNMLTTKILYTAVTRAKKEMYIVGQEEAINKAIHEHKKNIQNYRISRLADKLQSN